MPHWQWWLMHLSRQLWVRATLIGSLGILAALMAAIVEKFVPWRLPSNIGSDAVGSILNIIASSMLAVTTFSLSVVTAAYANAAQGVTPRATKLIMEDRITQNVLSTFVGSFLFAIVGIVVLRTEAYGERGRFILFVVTIAVIAMIVISLLRWIDHLTKLGRAGETIARVEQAAAKAIRVRIENPYLGGRPLLPESGLGPETGMAITCQQVGYVQNIDMTALNAAAGKRDCVVEVVAVPGCFIYSGSTIARVTGAVESRDELQKAVTDAFAIGEERSFDQDPRFGLAVMSEIGLRALSPGVNDPGTALAVIGRLSRLLAIWAELREDRAPDFPNVYVPPLRTADLFEDAFMLIARDGAGAIEVQLRLQKSLSALSTIGDVEFQNAAYLQAQMAWDRAKTALTLSADRKRLEQAVLRAE